MLSDITIGQFFPGDSVLHRLDPRLKIVLLIMLFGVIFWVDNPISYAFLSLATACLIVLSHLPPGMLMRSLKPLWWIILFTFLIHLGNTPGEEVGHLWGFTFTREGFWHGFFLSLRLVLVILLSSLLTFTTSPLKLTDALESLLNPLRHVGLPSHELAMMMTIALRFVPTLIEETDRLIKAQKSRGVDFSGSIMKRVQAVVPILVPLFISAFRRADDLAMAMEARCYRGGEGRTHMKVLKIGATDYCAAAVGISVALAALMLDLYA